jgi:hypothetical protein
MVSTGRSSEFVTRRCWAVRLLLLAVSEHAGELDQAFDGIAVAEFGRGTPAGWSLGMTPPQSTTWCALASAPVLRAASNTRRPGQGKLGLNASSHHQHASNEPPEGVRTFG